MKAQMVKNAVIVPVGAKGGFVVKRPPAGRARPAGRGEACYRTFMRGLLDLTDNLVAGHVVPPPGVVRHDGDDPYLVVAADKGTATFSDIANEIAAEYGFWLGDAFASGGSNGYDHKAMGITARGAWESVKRHFRELGIDVQRDPSPWSASATCRATCSATACCCPAHPLSPPSTTGTSSSTPTPTRNELRRARKRLFALPRSSWDDYDPSADLRRRRRVPRAPSRSAVARGARLLGIADRGAHRPTS
jgi:glutamate dehydrogenase